jgi:RNA 3'-terminal phosphate cyclase (ATP)
MMTIDGSMGEGGGQILRSSLALSLATGTPFTIDRIRAHRKKPGLMRQHLTAVEAAAAVGQAGVDGAALGSRRLTFAPARVTTGEHRFSVGTAGSTTLVLQAVLPALLTAEGTSSLLLEGGTHNPFAPPYPFLERAFLPLVSRMGPEIRARLERPGFYPAGGGRFQVRVRPAERLTRLDLTVRGAVRQTRAEALVANLNLHIGRREIERVRKKLSWDPRSLEVVRVEDAEGPGNALMLEVRCEHVTEVFSAFGRRGVRAEAVADEAIRAARRYLDSDAPVGEHLADQLLVPMALGDGGTLRTLAPTSHTLTNIEVLKRFLEVDVEVRAEGQAYRIEVMRKDRSWT